MAQEKTRLRAIDLARGLAVFFMILVHVLITYSAPEVAHSLFGNIVGFLGGPPAAPVFMALMGISFYYSRHTEFKYGIQRGLWLILLGYILNLLRGVLPIVYVNLLSPSRAAQIPDAVASLTDAFLELDILQFAGLAFIAMAVIREVRVNRYVLLLLAAATAMVSPFLWGVGSDVPVAGHLLDYLWGNIPSQEPSIGNLVSFPFFPWFAYVLVGMFLGDTLKRSTDLNATFRKMGLIGFLISVISLAFIAPNYSYHVGDFYHSRPGFVAFVVGIVLAWVYLCQLAVGHIRPNRPFEVIYYWSKNVNVIYLVQWVLIMWGADLILGFNKSSYSTTVFVMLFMAIASHAITGVWLHLKRRDAPHVSAEA